MSIVLNNFSIPKLSVPQGYEYHYSRKKRKHLMKPPVPKNSFIPTNYYSLIFLDIADLKAYFDTLFPSIKKEYMLKDWDYEEAYDWLVNEAVSKIFLTKKTSVEKHYSHDIYKCIYSEIGAVFEEHIKTLVENQSYAFLLGKKVKTLVAFNNLIIGRSNG